MTWIADVRYAARRLRRQPAYGVLAVLTLALGVAGTAAIYGVTRGVLFDALPYEHEAEIGIFWKKTDWTEEEFLFIRGRVPGFQQVALYRQRDAILRHGAEPARLVRDVPSSFELFEVLGVRPMIGRGFHAGDDVPGAGAVVVLSFGLWRELGGDASIVGTPLTIDGTPRTVIGVMPSGFWFPDPSARIWTSVPLSPEGRNWNSTLVGRVAPGQSVRSMQAPVAQLTAMLDERFDYPAQWDKTRDAHITPIVDDFTGAVRPALYATLGAMALILLIACANVAALMLGQVDARSVELAVRSALGANRLRLAQSLAIEAMLIAAAAGTLGAAVARASFDVLLRALPLGAWAESASPDWRVFATAMAIAFAGTLLVILAPVVAVSRGDLRTALSSIRTAGLRGRGGRLENALVVAEVALAVVIAAGAALVARSVAKLYAVDPGVRTEDAAIVDVILDGRLPRAGREQRVQDLTQALGALAGVQSVAVTEVLPMRGGGYNMPLAVEGRPDIKGMTTEYRFVTPGYLEALGIALRDGRSIAATDRRDTERVVVINEALARKFFAGVNPIGKRIGGDIDGPPARIVGIVANAAERWLTDPAEPVRYVALAQMPWIDDWQTFVLRAAPGVDETSLLEPARRVVAQIAPGAAVQQTTTLRRVLDAAIGPARPVVRLLSLMTVLALTLGAVGIYGVIAHFTARRRREWAIRVALGLPASRVIGHVIGRGVLLVMAGIGLGLAAAAALARVFSSLLYGVSAIDPIALALAAAALLTVGIAAAFVPAWRAGMTDPAIALREQ